MLVSFPAGAALSLGGCVSTDLAEFNVFESGAALQEPVGPLTIQGITQAAFINQSNATSFTIGGSCVDEGRGITIALVSSAGGSMSDQFATCTAGTWNATANYAALTDGPLVLRASWSDDPAVTDDLSLTLDTVAPDLALLTLTTSSLLRGGGSQTISWSTTATDTPAAAVTLGFDNGVTWSEIVAGRAPSGSYGWTVPPLDGTGYQVRVTIRDLAGNSAEVLSAPIAIDSIRPSVSIEQHASQLDPTNSASIAYTITFSEPVDPASFSLSDLTIGGTASSVGLDSLSTGDNQTFTLVTSSVGTPGTVTVSLPAGRVTDLAGNTNTASSSADNTVTFDNVAPTVTVNQKTTAPAQADPTNALPVRFTVVFSEPINPATFTTADLTNSGSTTVGSWNIINLGDDRGFTVEATSASGTGTILLGISSGRVQDLAGNFNQASTGTDGMVTYDVTAPVLSITSAAAPASYVNASTAASFPLSGNCTVGDGTVTVRAVDSGAAERTATTSCNSGGGNWSVNIDVSALAEGPLSFTASQTDAAGNLGTSGTHARTKDTAPPDLGGLVFLINNGDTRTQDVNLSIHAYSSMEPVDRYYTLTAGCSSGGAWVGANGTPFAETISDLQPHTQFVYARFRDVAQNETSCLSRSIELDVLYPTHVYPAFNRWNDYVQVDNSGNPLDNQSGLGCTTAQTRVEACLHSGEFLKVETDEDDCLGLVLTDDLDAFHWSCAVRDGKVVFFSKGFRPGKGLGDLLEIDAGTPRFRNIGVALSGGLSTRDVSIPRVWWSNPVVAAPDSTGGVQTLSSSGTVYVLPATDTSGQGYTIGFGTMGISFVVLPGGRLLRTTATYGGTTFSVSNGNQHWIEGEFGTATTELQNGLNISGTTRTRLHRIRVVGGSAPADTVGRTGIYINTGRTLMLTDVEVQRIRSTLTNSAGIRIASSPDALLDRISVAEGPDNGACIRLEGTSSDARLRNIRASNCNIGIHISAPMSTDAIHNTVIQGAVISHSNSGINIQSWNSTNVSNTHVTGVTLVENGNGIVFGNQPLRTVIHQGFLGWNDNGFNDGSAPILQTTLGELVVYGSTTNGILFTQSGSTAKGTGTLLMGGNANGCSVININNGFTGLCAVTGSSNHTLNPVGGTDLDLSFFGLLDNFTPDTVFGNYYQNYELGFSNWFGLDSVFRTFGRADDRGRCNGTNPLCGIFDWRLRDSDTQVLKRSVALAKGGPNIEGPDLLAAGSCPINGNDVLTSHSSTKTYLRHAIEILFDRSGDDDGLCESGERCLFTPNFGAYQGHGEPTRMGCTFGNGTISNVELLFRPNNGIPYIATPPGDDGGAAPFL